MVSMRSFGKVWHGGGEALKPMSQVKQQVQGSGTGWGEPGAHCTQTSVFLPDRLLSGYPLCFFLTPVRKFGHLLLEGLGSCPTYHSNRVMLSGRSLAGWPQWLWGQGSKASLGSLPLLTPARDLFANMITLFQRWGIWEETGLRDFSSLLRTQWWEQRSSHGRG